MKFSGDCVDFSSSKMASDSEQVKQRDEVIQESKEEPATSSEVCNFSMFLNFVCCFGTRKMAVIILSG